MNSTNISVITIMAKSFLPRFYLTETAKNNDLEKAGNQSYIDKTNIQRPAHEILVIFKFFYPKLLNCQSKNIFSISSYSFLIFFIARDNIFKLA